VCQSIRSDGKKKLVLLTDVRPAAGPGKLLGKTDTHSNHGTSAGIVGCTYPTYITHTTFTTYTITAYMCIMKCR
jgi:hypothetical protein